MKNQLLLILFLCSISHFICSMERTFDGIEIKLTQESADQLLKISIESISKGKPGYWPENAKIILVGFYLLKDGSENTDNPRYAVRLEGQYKRIDLVNGCLMQQTIRKFTNGAYRKNEFDALGFNVPENS